MTQVVNKIVAPKEDNSDYPFLVNAANVEMPNGMSLAQFYQYVMDFMNKGHFVMFNEQEPQSEQVKIWYDTKEDNLQP